MQHTWTHIWMGEDEFGHRYEKIGPYAMFCMACGESCLNIEQFKAIDNWLCDGYYFGEFTWERIPSIGLLIRLADIGKHILCYDYMNGEFSWQPNPNLERLEKWRNASLINRRSG